MRRVIFVLWLLGCVGGVEAACPSRDNTYIQGQIIQPQDVLDNENALFEGIQSGLETDCIANNAITTAKIATGAVTSADILDGTITQDDLSFSVSGNELPSGAVFFMFSGSCPSWTTDVSATYSNLFVRVNATTLTYGGANSHTHTAGSYASASHTHSVSTTTDSGTLGAGGGPTMGGGTTPHTHAVSTTTATGSGGAVSGTSASTDNIPSFVTARLCLVP